MLEYTLMIIIPDNDNANVEPLFKISFKPVSNNGDFVKLLNTYEPVYSKIEYVPVTDNDLDSTGKANLLQAQLKMIQNIHKGIEYKASDLRNMRIHYKYIFLVDTLDQICHLCKKFQYTNIDILDTETLTPIGYIDVKYTPAEGSQVTRRIEKERFSGETTHHDKRFI